MRPLFAQLPVAFGVGVRLAASLAELVDSTSCIHAIIVMQSSLKAPVAHVMLDGAWALLLQLRLLGLMRGHV